MLHNIDQNSLNAVKARDPEAAQIIDTLIANHIEIVSTISHEIRNPLTLAYSSLQLIASKYPEARKFKYWDTTVEAVELMKVLLEQLSTFNNSTRLDCTPINLSLMLRSTALTHTISLYKQSIDFQVDVPYGLPQINVDRIKFQQVLLNLIRNAYEAMGKDGTISIGTKVHNNQLEISITDNGIGMSAHTLETAFDLFKTRKPNGTGLGLPISRRIIEAHGGTLTATSSFGEGSTFTILLPIYEDC